jgi:hypothetical protein
MAVGAAADLWVGPAEGLIPGTEHLGICFSDFRIARNCSTDVQLTPETPMVTDRSQNLLVASSCQGFRSSHKIR